MDILKVSIAVVALTALWLVVTNTPGVAYLLAWGITFVAFFVWGAMKAAEKDGVV